jgi:membrane protein implicated in regulation of membrane protease activity
MADLTSGIFDNLHFWHWWVFAIVLFILEMLSPGIFLMWIGFAAVITGAILLALPDMGWQAQFVIFAIAGIVAVIAGRMWFQRNPIVSDQPALNERSDDLIGKVYEVQQAIKNGEGRIKVGESTWKAIGPDCAEGTQVRVVSVNGAIVKVETV